MQPGWYLLRVTTPLLSRRVGGLNNIEKTNAFQVGLLFPLYWILVLFNFLMFGGLPDD